MRRKYMYALLGMTSLLLLAGCGGQAQQEEGLTRVRLNEVVHSIFYAPQYVAIELGFFEEYGIEIELEVGNGADRSMTALLSDNADIGLMGTEASFYVFNEGREDFVQPFA